MSKQLKLGGPRTEVTVNFDVSDCKNNPGPFIKMDGELKIEAGLNGRLVFRNNAKGTHEHEEELAFNLEIVPPGYSVKFAKQPSRGGVGGNPHIYFQLTDSDGDVSAEHYLGRCVQLSK